MVVSDDDSWIIVLSPSNGLKEGGVVGIYFPGRRLLEGGDAIDGTIGQPLKPIPIDTHETRQDRTKPVRYDHQHHQ